MDEPKSESSDSPNAHSAGAHSADTHSAGDGGGHGPPPGEPKRWLDDRKNVDKIFYALCTICLALTVVDLVHAYHKHAHFSFEDIPAFHAGFGFLAYVGLVLTATQLRRLLKRDENYYD